MTILYNAAFLLVFCAALRIAVPEIVRGFAVAVDVLWGRA